MKIQDKDKRLVDFKDVYVGDVFSYNEVYYMKIIKTNKGNAVILVTGDVVDFESYIRVEEIEGSYVRQLY